MSIPASQDRMNAEQLVVRPRGKQYRRWLGATPAFMIIFVIIAFSYATRPRALLGDIRGITLVLCALAAVLALAATYVYIRRAHVVVTPTEIGKAGFTGRPKMRPRSDVATVVTATMRYPADSRVFRSIFVFDQSGQRIMRLRSMYWAVEDMERIAESLGIAPVDIPGPVSGAQLAKEYPNAVMGFERRPFFYSGLLVATLILLPFAYGIIVATIRVIAD